MDWFGKMLNLPNCFLFSGGGGGVLQGTTCEAMLCTIVAARDQMLRKIGRENFGKLVVYASDQTHFSLKKAADIAGIDPENFRVIPTIKADEYALCPKSLRLAVLNDINEGNVPLFLCATIGTTSTTSVKLLRNLGFGYMWMQLMREVLAFAPSFNSFLMVLKMQILLVSTCTNGSFPLWIVVAFG